MSGLSNISSSTSVALMQMAQQIDNPAIATAKAAKNAEGTKSDDKFDTAARDFEAMFLTELIKPMMETIKVDDEFGGGKGEDVFRGFMVQEYGKKMANAGGIGLASSIKAALIKAQSGQNVPDVTDKAATTENVK